jgi:hypothetical protein
MDEKKPKKERKASKFVPLTLAGINEGMLLTDVASELSEGQKYLAKFVDDYGSAAYKQEVTITVKIKIKVASVTPATDDTDAHATFAILPSVTKTMPKRPIPVSTAMIGVDEDNQPSLFVRSSGSSGGNPTQLKLSTDDGRTIVDGEVQE